MKNPVLTIMLALAICAANASNPVSLTRFFQQYAQLNEVQNIQDNGVLNGEVAQFLLNDNNPIDQKAAVINTFSVNNALKNTAETYKQFVSRQYGVAHANLDLDQLNGEELFVLGYLTLMDNQGDPSYALPLLKKANMKFTNSQTITMILALAEAQRYLENGDSCGAWQMIENVTSNEMNNDLDQEAVNLIVTANINLKSACE